MFSNKSTVSGLAIILLLAGSSMAAIQYCTNEQWNPTYGNYVCYSCSYGYYVSSSQTQCLSCNSAMSGCASCSNGNTCSTCSSSYYMNTSSRCSSCSSGCSSCSSYSVCQTCRSGYFYVSSSTSCSSCTSNCDTCTSYKTCTSCSFTYEKKTDASGFDTCNATAGTAIMFILLIIGIILCLPIIICCFCWASIAQCLGWRTVQTINYNTAPDNGNSFDPGFYGHQPANPGFHQPAGNFGQPFPNQPGNPAYGNTGMPWGR